MSRHARMLIVVGLVGLMAACGGGAAAGPGPVGPGPAGPGPSGGGDLVLARYRGGDFWFPGRVTASDPSGVAVAYLDGERATVPAGDVRPLDWQVGTKVECNWQKKGKFFPGTIASIAGEQAHISYDDGDQEDLSIGNCRSR